MEKVVYNLKEIILGLRDGYIANNDALNSLKNYLYSCSLVSEYDFFLYQNEMNSDAYAIFLKYLSVFKDNKKVFKPEELIYSLSNVYFANDGSKAFFDFTCPLKIHKQKEFVYKANEIIRSEFAKLITRSNMKSMNNCYLSTSLNSIDAYFGFDRLSYDAKKDKVVLSIARNTLVSEQYILDYLNSLLLTCFYRDEFSNYMYENIKKYEDDKIFNLCSYNSSYSLYRTFEFDIANELKLLKDKKSLF